MRYDKAVLHINAHIQIPESELRESFIRSSGPGGQNVNKVASAVQLRFDLENTNVLPAEAKARLKRLAGSRLTSQGEILIEAKRYRDQEKNRADARLRLAALIRRALEKPKKRRPTRPSRSSMQKRLDEKKKRGEIKKRRSGDWVD